MSRSPIVGWPLDRKAMTGDTGRRHTSAHGPDSRTHTSRSPVGFRPPCAVPRPASADRFTRVRLRASDIRAHRRGIAEGATVKSDSGMRASSADSNPASSPIQDRSLHAGASTTPAPQLRVASHHFTSLHFTSSEIDQVRGFRSCANPGPHHAQTAASETSPTTARRQAGTHRDPIDDRCMRILRDRGRCGEPV